MLAYQATDGCRMEYLRRQLDDPAAAPCGRCDNCTGRPWPREVSEAGAAAAADRAARIDAALGGGTGFHRLSLTLQYINRRVASEDCGCWR